MTTHWFLSGMTQIVINMSIGVAVTYSFMLVTARAFLAGWRWRFPTSDARRDFLARRADWRESAERLRGDRRPGVGIAIFTSHEVGRWVRIRWGWQDPHPFVGLEGYLLCAFALALLFGGLQGTSWFLQQCLRESAAGAEGGGDNETMRQ
ncbi:MAG TPA: hypothetical protein VGO11_20780 [Chthoniobacteraceae bacterium]|jgi:hypothetical protein|nr:hypothetical protein [Chthoniobacteraceae bacterium]